MQNKRSSLGFLILLGVQMLVLCDQEPISVVSCQQLDQEMKLSISYENDLYVINVLPRNVCADCKIPGTLNIPFHKLPNKIRNWPKNRKIVVYCAGLQCPLGRYAYHYLLNHGFVNVRLYAGGMREWKGQNFTTLGPCKAGYLKG